MEYTSQELMVICAARQIQDHEIVFIGIRLPLLAFAVAKRTHAPHCLGLFEEGILRETPAAECLYTIGDPANICGALWTTRTANVMGLMASGEVQMGIIGSAQVDYYGNLNTSVIGDWHQPLQRLPGSGGAADIASLAQRVTIIMQHDHGRLQTRVNYITSPGYGHPTEAEFMGVRWRQHVGLPRGGPATLITTLGIFTFDKRTGRALLQSIHPGISQDQLQRQTGWSVQYAVDCTVTRPPTEEELHILRQCDPEGRWTK